MNFFFHVNNCHLHKEHLYSRVIELLNNSIYPVHFAGLADIPVTIHISRFLFVGLSKQVQ
jgi:hypothetical protein